MFPFKKFLILILKQIFWSSFNKILNKLKKDENKQADENGKNQSKKLKNISLIFIESEFSNTETISHFILFLNNQISIIFRNFYVLILDFVLIF